MISRRRFLQHSGTLATGLSLGRTGWARGFADSNDGKLLDVSKLKPFVDPLPILPVVHGGPLRPDPNDASPPKAFYLPVRPGCVFQAYVRSDLLR